MRELFFNIYFIIGLAVLLPFFVILVRLRSIGRLFAAKLMASYIVIDVVSATFSIVLILCNNHNIIVTNVFSIFEFFIISLFFIEIIRPKKKKTYQIMVCLLTLGLCIRGLSHANTSFDNFSITIKSIIFIFLSITYFSKLMREQIIDNLFAYPNFWFNTGILVYFSSSIIIMAFSNYFFNLSLEAQKILWLIHSFINLICYIIFAIGFYKCKLKQKY